MIPFILGAAAGAVAVVAVNNRKNLKEKIAQSASDARANLSKGFGKAKSLLSKGAEDVKEGIEDLGDGVKKKVHAMTAETEMKEAK